MIDNLGRSDDGLCDGEFVKERDVHAGVEAGLPERVVGRTRGRLTAFLSGCEL
jgi:hypothetical protein